MRAASSPEALVERAAARGQKALAISDDWTVSGSVAHARACKATGIKPLHGAQVQIDDVDLVLLAADEEGYGALCDLLTKSFKRGDGSSSTDSNSLTWNTLYEHTTNLFCLADFRRPISSNEYARTRRISAQLKQAFTNRFFIELIHHERPGDGLLLQRLQQLAEAADVKCVASNAVRHATRERFQLFDALTCAKQKITVAQGHPARPYNDNAYLCSEKYFRRLGFPSTSIANTEAIANECTLDLLAPVVTPPEAHVPVGETPRSYLQKLCHQGFRERYPHGNRQAVVQLKKELDIIFALELEEFFLAVYEVMAYARSRGILCSGRGSAANSIVAYLLHITQVDPIANHLLFERFLHLGRTGTPDIDSDFASDRRDEVIEWIHQRWSEGHTAMTANIVTFRMRSAVQEMGKVLGYTPEMVEQASSRIPHGNCRDVWECRDELASALGDSPAMDVLCGLVSQMNECPHYLGLHSGGMILSRRPLRYLSPLQTSRKGVRQIQYDKDAVEKRGEIKFDVLSLRALGAVAEAVAHIRVTQSPDEKPFSLEGIPLDDEATFDLICSGKTLSLFQIESPGQMRLSVEMQPRSILDLTFQVALFRPGPLQSSMVSPFIARRRGWAKVRYLHPSLEPVLKDTYGIILFQEQVLQVAQVFAGMSSQESDEFRRLMSKFRSPTEMEAMRQHFVEGAIKLHKVSIRLANKVFDLVAKFVGYGFCRSHAAAFAYWVYVTAYLKAHYPVQYLAATLEHLPGFWPLQSFLQEARQLGISILPVNLLYSEAKVSIEYNRDMALSIRIPFTKIKGITKETAAAIVLARALKPFKSLREVASRLSLNMGQWENLARSGALDCFASGALHSELPDDRSPDHKLTTKRREVLWQVRTLVKDKTAGSGDKKKRKQQSSVESSQQLQLGIESLPPIPKLSALEVHELIQWDFDTLGLTTQVHPLALHRPLLNVIGVTPIKDLHSKKPGSKVLVAGSVTSRQKPPTAKNFCFIVLEDETDRLPTAIPPHVYDAYKHKLHRSALILEGILEVSKHNENTYYSVLVQSAWPLKEISRHGVVVGAAGFPGQNPRFATAGTHEQHENSCSHSIRKIPDNQRATFHRKIHHF